MNSSLKIVCRCQMSILPYDIFWLSSFKKVKIIFHKLLKCGLFGTKKRKFRFKFLSNNETIFLFKSDESVNRAGNFLKLLVCKLRNLFFNFSHLIISLVHYVLTSYSQKLNKFIIVEGKYNICYFYLLNLDIFGV